MGRSFKEFFENVGENIFIRGTNNTINVEKDMNGENIFLVLRECVDYTPEIQKYQSYKKIYMIKYPYVRSKR